jgi:tRNA (mo5U34)-methyltransferase
MDRKSLEAEVLGRAWFYEFELPSGRKTRSYLPAEVLSIHETRGKMAFEHLEQRLEDRWTDLRCLDLGCNEGYFALQLALRGCRQVLGIDARQDNVAHATLIRDLHGLENLDFRIGNVLELTGSELGEFDVVLMFGLLYHVPDIIGVLKLARAVTRGICLIETQVAPELSAEVEWGAKDWKKPIEGCFAIVDETTELSIENREASLEATSLVPSRKALTYLLPRLGFAQVEVLTPPADANEQLARGCRVMIAAR